MFLPVRSTVYRGQTPVPVPMRAFQADPDQPETRTSRATVQSDPCSGQSWHRYGCDHSCVARKAPSPPRFGLECARHASGAFVKGCGGHSGCPRGAARLQSSGRQRRRRRTSRTRSAPGLPPRRRCPRRRLASTRGRASCLPASRASAAPAPGLRTASALRGTQADRLATVVSPFAFLLALPPPLPSSSAVPVHRPCAGIADVCMLFWPAQRVRTAEAASNVLPMVCWQVPRCTAECRPEALRV